MAWNQEVTDQPNRCPKDRAFQRILRSWFYHCHRNTDVNLYLKNKIMMQKNKIESPHPHHRWGRVSVTESVRDQACPTEVGVLEGKYCLLNSRYPLTCNKQSACAFRFATCPGPSGSLRNSQSGNYYFFECQGTVIWFLYLKSETHRKKYFLPLGFISLHGFWELFNHLFQFKIQVENAQMWIDI